MNNFNFYSPTYFVFGKERENEVGKYITRFGGHKVLIHYGGGSVVKSGLLDRVKNALTIEGIAYVELGGVMPNPRDGLVYQGIEICKKEEGMYKRGAAADALRPKFSVLNPELTNTLPVYQTACGATDIMAHILERYFTNTKDVDITDALCEAVLSTIVKSVPKLI